VTTGLGWLPETAIDPQREDRGPHHHFGVTAAPRRPPVYEIGALVARNTGAGVPHVVQTVYNRKPLLLDRGRARALAIP